MFFAPVTFTSLTDMGMDIWSAICWTLAGRVTARDSLFSYHCAILRSFASCSAFWNSGVDRAWFRTSCVLDWSLSNVAAPAF